MDAVAHLAPTVGVLAACDWAGPEILWTVDWENLNEGEVPCPQERNTILEPRREPAGRLSVLDMNDRLGVQVPYRACWRQL